MFACTLSFYNQPLVPQHTINVVVVAVVVPFAVVLLNCAQGFLLWKNRHWSKGAQATLQCQERTEAASLISCVSLFT